MTTPLLKALILEKRIPWKYKEGIKSFFLRKNKETFDRLDCSFFKRLQLIFTKNSIFDKEFITQKSKVRKTVIPKKVIEKIINIYNPKSVLDLGCGNGEHLRYFLKNNVKDLIGVDGSEFLKKQSKIPQYIKIYDLRKELNLKRKFDIIFSYEFVEHIHEKHIKNLLNSFSNHSGVIILTAARPGQGGIGHYNEQEPEYWIERFSNKGYIFNSIITNELKKSKDIFSENILVFERK